MVAHLIYTMKKLYRSEENKISAGILGGIAEYLEMDPVVVRVLFVFITILTGFFPGVIFYIACLFIIPKKTISHTHTTHTVSDTETQKTEHNTEEDAENKKTTV